MDEANDPLIERAKQRVGHTLKDKWRLDELIGVGGMAAVYSATHRNGSRVAVKMLHTELSVSSGEIKNRFSREGHVANKVQHPGAVQVSDDDVDEDGTVFLVMELLDGETLAHRFERKARSLVIEEVLLVADQVLDVLAAAHEKDIVHRDIKPDNIFLTRTGGVKLLDFGIARLRELSTESNATRSGSTMGTPAYMAPEQARARWDEVDARTDLWAVGATMFKLLTGRVVHVADTVNEQLLAAMTQPAPPIGTLAPTVPIPVVEVVDKALAFTKEDRWKDARSMQRAIREAYKAIAGDTPAAVRLSFDDEGAVGHADTIAAPSGKVATSLTAAHDSAAFGSRRPRRRSRVGLLLTLGAVGAGAYFFLTRTKVPVALQLETDGGVLGGAALGIPSAIARIEQALPNSPSTAESALPGRTETPPLVDPVAASAAPSSGATPLAAASSSPDNTGAPNESTDTVPDPTPSAAPPSVVAASAPNPQPRTSSPVHEPEPKVPAVRKAPSPAPPKKHTHHRRRP
jgi:serine/threonine-protein kinase